MANDIDVYDYTDGIFLGRYNTEAYAGEASFGVGSNPLTTPPDDIPTADLAYRVDTQFYNSLYVTDVNKKYVKPKTTDISKNLLIHAYNTLQDQAGKNITRTKIIDENNREHNALDVYDFSGVDYLSTIYNKFFNEKYIITESESTYIDVFTDRSPRTFYWYDNYWADDYSGTTIGFGDEYKDASGIFTSMYNSNQKLRQLMTYDYSANKQYLELYNTFMTYQTTQQLQKINSNFITTNQLGQLNNNQYIDLTNKFTKSISFYGTVNKPCRICIAYVNSYSSNTGNQSPNWFNITEQTQYDTTIKKTGTIKFGFNIDKIVAKWIIVLFRDINTNKLIVNDNDFTPNVYASYNYIISSNISI